MIAYRFDDNGIFTGETMDAPPEKGIPMGWTRSSPPEIPAGKHAKFSGGQWTILDYLPPPAPDPVPERVSQRQARLVLLSHGLLASIPAHIAAIEDAQQRQAAEIEWEYATQISRQSPLVIMLAESLELTSEQLDNLFREAAQIPD